MTLQANAAQDLPLFGFLKRIYKHTAGLGRWIEQSQWFIYTGQGEDRKAAGIRL